jgi:hypothetical protein
VANSGEQEEDDTRSHVLAKGTTGRASRVESPLYALNKQTSDHRGRTWGALKRGGVRRFGRGRSRDGLRALCAGDAWGRSVAVSFTL